MHRHILCVFYGCRIIYYMFFYILLFSLNNISFENPPSHLVELQLIIFNDWNFLKVILLLVNIAFFCSSFFFFLPWLTMLQSISFYINLCKEILLFYWNIHEYYCWMGLWVCVLIIIPYNIWCQIAFAKGCNTSYFHQQYMWENTFHYIPASNRYCGSF